MNCIHPNDRAYALERALAAATAQGEDRKVLEDLREILAEARQDARTVESSAAVAVARKPGAQVPVATATQPGKRVSILESACGPARKFDPVAADAELASVPLAPLWELPELHPRKVAAECLTTMEQARQSTRPNKINRVKLTDAIALVGRFVAQMERSERLGTAPPAQGIDLHRMVPPEWISELIGGQMDDLTPGQAWRQGFNQCRERTLLLVEQALGFPVDQQCDAAPGVGE